MSDTSTQSRALRLAVASEVNGLLGRRRMSDIALARAMGRSHTYLYRRLIAETAFDVDDLERIAEIFEVEVADLLPRSKHRLGDTALNGRYERVNGTLVTKIPSVPIPPRPTRGVPIVRGVEAAQVIRPRNRSVSLSNVG